MNKINIFKFIIFKDIAEYLKKINYQFNAFEAASIIIGACNVPMKERFEALKEILYFLPDCKGVDRDSGEWIHIHKTIKNYIMDANEFIASLIIDRDYSFSYEYIGFKSDYSFISGRGGKYKTFEEAINGSKNDDELQKNKNDRTILFIIREKNRSKNEYSVDKAHINNDVVNGTYLTNDDVDKIVLTSDYEISEITERSSISDSITDHPFKGKNVHAPVPFKKGDKIWDYYVPVDACNLPLVYEFLEVTPDGLKVINFFDEEEIIENYMRMEYYKK